MFFSVIPVRVYFTFLTSSNKQQIFPEVKKKIKNQKPKKKAESKAYFVYYYSLSTLFSPWYFLFAILYGKSPNFT